MRMTRFRLLFTGAWLLNTASGLRFLANSEAGQRLLREARVEVQPERRLADNVNGELDIGAMYIKYQGCSSYQDRGIDYYQYWKDYNNYDNAGEGTYDAYNNNQNYHRNNYYFQDYGNRRRLEDMNVEMVNLIRFTLCYDSGCGKCSGQYAIDMLTFLSAYNEHTQTELKFRCEAVRNQCYCENNSDNQYTQQKCYKSCYKQAGLSHCSQFDENYSGQQQQFPLEEYLQCKRK